MQKFQLKDAKPYERVPFGLVKADTSVVESVLESISTKKNPKTVKLLAEVKFNY